MKIIISHDVDHLYASDHWFKDLFIEKLWVRSLLQLVKREIDAETFFYRLILPFHNKIHRIDELMKFDRSHKIPSVFFFGMANGLGMSYRKSRAYPIIKKVMDQSFDVGVHGIDYQWMEGIKKEHDDFLKMSGLKNFGIRNHYVRFDEHTFYKQSEVGYLFDSTWFDKKKLNLKAPYKVGDMWEFPLHVMDGYICREGKWQEGVRATVRAVEKAVAMGMPYCTILFHDFLFNENCFPQLKRWYMEIIEYCEKNGYEFISYREAIEELEHGRI